jgi:hypothetical protein
VQENEKLTCVGSIVRSKYMPHGILFSLLALTTAALVFCVGVEIVDQIGVKMELPPQVGAWRGEDIFFCQDEKCQRSFRTSQLAGKTVCPVCGGVLRQTWSLGESWLLPADTILLRKLYVHPSGQQLMVSVVVSGKEQVSIHRPEICLVAQGNEVAGRSTLTVPLEGRKPLHIRNLETFRRFRAQSGSMIECPEYFAYWFVGQRRETPYHLMRMAYTAMDRVFFSKAYRWTYVAISGMRTAGSDSYQQQEREFIRLFYPLIVAP